MSPVTLTSTGSTTSKYASMPIRMRRTSCFDRLPVRYSRLSTNSPRESVDLKILMPGGGSGSSPTPRAVPFRSSLSASVTIRSWCCANSYSEGGRVSGNFLWNAEMIPPIWCRVGPSIAVPGRLVSRSMYSGVQDARVANWSTVQRPESNSLQRRVDS